jgi:tRNA threonylcarbamoyladenosine biosynthesis protein TsaB
VIVVGLDTATPATSAAVLRADGSSTEARHDPPPGSRGAHASRLLPLLAAAMHEAGVAWEDVDRLAVGAGPGGFTGLRIGIATARALAQARGLPVVPASSLRALALPHRGPVLAAIDARRGEVFAAAWDREALLLAPAAWPPDALARALADLPTSLLAVGDGSVRFRAELEGAGAVVPADASPAHRLSAVAICTLGAVGEPVDRNTLAPDYLREPDATPRQP